MHRMTVLLLGIGFVTTNSFLRIQSPTHCWDGCCFDAKRNHPQIYSTPLALESQSESKDEYSRMISRAIEITTVAAGLAVPLITSAVPAFLSDGIETNLPENRTDNGDIGSNLDVWDRYWRATATNENLSNAQL